MNNKDPNKRKEFRRTQSDSYSIGWSKLQHRLPRSSNLRQRFGFERPGRLSHHFPIACVYKLMHIHFHEGKRGNYKNCTSCFFNFMSIQRTLLPSKWNLWESCWVLHSFLAIITKVSWKKINALTSKLFQQRLLPPYLPSHHLQHVLLCPMRLQFDLEQIIRGHFSRKETIPNWNWASFRALIPNLVHLSMYDFSFGCIQQKNGVHTCKRYIGFYRSSSMKLGNKSTQLKFY